ncbi:MAG: hypothetical protein EP329_24440 [Deltaproteobacteria bacterium]|nr:MAG: hypothetical protein EP329_24440 [Deltaproteobacteria bacterium]
MNAPSLPIARGLRALLLASSLLLVPACGDDTAPGGTDTSVGTDTFISNDTSIPTDTSGGANNAPELERIGDRVVPVGQTLVIVVSAKDADGDALTYSVFGTLPAGARFDKGAHRFEWTPETAGTTVFLTFVVSDGTEFDRETVRIEVSSGDDQHPPAFVKVGDQQLTVGKTFELKLQATDPDGDELTYGNEGALPGGATLDGATGAFRWTPTADAVGTARVTFTVSDGALSDTMPVRLVVGDGSGGGPEPPVVTPVAPQTVAVGQTLSFTLQATDPNQDALTWAISEGAPQGAQLSGATFSWTPGQADAGKAWEVVFSVSDGTFTVLTSVQLSVTSGGTGTCTPDANEPNEDLATATEVGAGTLQKSICETQQGVYDLDIYKIAVPAQNQLTAELSFDASMGDLDLYILDASESFLAASEEVTSPERASYIEANGRDLYVAVVGFGDAPLKLGYTLTLTLGPAPTDVCVDDSFEPNDTPATAKPITENDLALCGGDVDYWTLAVGCGQHVEIGLAITGDGADDDLDMRLYDTATASSAPVASAETEDDFEIIDVPSASKPGTWILEVYGYTQADAAAYALIAETSGGCVDDSATNHSAATADAIAGPSGFATGLKLCCAADWFALPLSAGEQVSAAVSPSSGSAGLKALASDGTTQLAAKAPSADGVQIQFTAGAAGTYYLVATGAVGTSYVLDWTVSAGGACTSLSCDTYAVCNADTGACVSDWCTSTAGCPSGHECVETYCANACSGDSDCRSGYACKHFAGTSRCGIVGSGGAGATCSDHTECSGALICSTEKTCQ